MSGSSGRAQRPRRRAGTGAAIRWLGIALLTALGACDPAAALERSFYVEHVGAEDALAQNTVNAILQDRAGFIWIGTQGGLHRYDGQNFRLYQNDPEDPTSLPDGFITALDTDDGDGLWIGTNGRGVAHLVPNKPGFQGDATLASDDRPGRRGRVTALMNVAGKGLLVGTGAGIEWRANDADRRVLLTLPGDNVADTRVGDFERARDGTIYAANSQGLFRIDPSTWQIQNAAADLPRPVYSVRSDDNGQIYAGTANGLFLIGPDGASHKLWPREAGGEEMRINAIRSAGKHRLWLAVYGYGLVTLHTDTGEVTVLRSQPLIHGSLPEDSVRSLAVDRSGLLWIGGDVHGVGKLDPEGARFVYVHDDNPQRAHIETNNIRSFLEDVDGSWWIGTEGDGLKRYDPATGRFDYFLDVFREALPAADRGALLRVFALASADAGQLWVATSLGLFRFDPKKRHATLLAADRVLGMAANDRAVRTMVKSRDGTLWLGTLTGGAVHYDPVHETFARYSSAPSDDNSLWHNAVLSLHEDRLGRIWIGTLDGLNLYDPQTGRMRRLPKSSRATDSLAGNLIRSFVETADGSLWIGSHNGLSKLLALDEGGARFQRYLARDGLPNATIYGILEDRSARLWLSTNRGIVMFNPANNSFRGYALTDGLQGIEFNGGSCLPLRDGRMMFGGSQGINVFSPERLIDSDFQPPVMLTGYQIGTQRYAADDRLEQPSLSIAQADRLVGIEFAAFDFAAPSRTRYQYQLQGFDARWIDNENRRSVTFTNLDSGQYTLRVRATNRDGVWSPKELVLPLTVRPPWWATSAMKLLYVALFLLLLASLAWAYRRRRRAQKSYTRALREREERLHVAIWGSGDEFWDWDMRRGVLFRIGADSLLGLTHEHEVSGDDWRRQGVHPDDLARVERVLEEHVSGKRDAIESEHRIKNARGEWVWVLSRGKIVERDENGAPVRVAGTARDITRTREAERQRRIADEVIRSMTEAVTVTDLEFRFVSVNASFTRMTGYSEGEIIGQASSVLNCAQHSEDFHQALRNTVQRTGHWSGEIWQRRRDGSEFLCWLELSEVTDEHRVRTHWVGVLTDITDRKRAEQELRYLANYDTLTGLPNRTLLGERLAHALIRARRHGSKVGVLFLDLDRFKHVNDSLGHAAGDRLLKAAAARLINSVRDSDTVARLGGDEFTVVVEDLADQAHAERVAQKLIDAFSAPLDIDGRSEVVISPSIGISIYPDHGQVPTDLLKFADTAMYQAKERGRNTYQTYTEAMDVQARLRANMVAHLHKALERGEFHLVFQPKVAIADGRVTGCEALLRWRNPALGAVPPSTFIPIAEEAGLIVPIGEWVLREALGQVQRWTRAGISSTTVAVNVSMLQLLRGELYTRLKALLEDFRVPGHRLELELTESVVMANAEQSISTLTQIKSLGVRLAIDDFGTGYSSLAYLKRLPIDTLKIDKEFVGDITTDADDEAITATIITMAHSLGLETVAEGVETQQQMEYLREQDCDELQGFLISAPLDAERCLKFLLDRKAQLERKIAGAGKVSELPITPRKPERQ